ncbi:MAG: hypothetical protein V4615_11320 [Bacteroidota bacterium]
MKKGLLSLIIISIAVSSLMLKAQDENSNGIYKSVDEEVGLEIFRGTGEVKLLIQVKDITQYHHIVVERSAETLNYFGKCKYISSAGVKLTDGKISEADKYPYSAAKNVYYRIKTVTTDGIERAYPAVLLPAITQ